MLAVLLFFCSFHVLSFGKYINIGMLYNGEIKDGWNNAIEVGRAYLQDVVYPAGINAEYYPSILNETEMYVIIKGWIDREFDLVIGTSWEYQEPMIVLAKEAEEDGKKTKFAVLTGWETSSNLMIANIYIHQVKYLLGYLSGLMSKTGRMCYIAATPDDAGLIASMMAQALGFRDAYPGAHTYAYFTGSWANETLETFAAQDCLKTYPDVDIFATQTDTTAVQEFAASQNLFSTGMSSDMRFTVGEHVLSSALFNWKPLLEEIVDRSINGSWISNYSAVSGIQQGSAALASLSNLVPATIAAHVLERKERMKNDSSMDAFCSPLVATYTTAPLDQYGCISNDDSFSVFGTVAQLPTDLITVVGNVELPPIPIVWLGYNSGIAIAFMIVAALGITFSFILLGYLIVSQNPLFAASSKEFLSTIIVGTIIGLISIFLIAGEPNPSQCQAFMWTTGTGFILVYGAILVKTFRIWFIFHKAETLEVAIITTYQLFAVLLLMLLLIYAILITWTVIDFPTVVYEESPLYPGSLVAKCYWQYYSAWMGAFLGYMGMFVVFGSVLSWLSRKIRAEIYNESKSLALIFYNLLVIGTILVSLLQTIELSLEAQFALEAVLITWIAYSGIVILFLPKIYKQARSESKSHITGTSGGSKV